MGCVVAVGRRAMGGLVMRHISRRKRTLQAQRREITEEWLCRALRRAWNDVGKSFKGMGLLVATRALDTFGKHHGR